MDNYPSIVADIKAKLLQIPNRGQVHDYERWFLDAAGYLEAYKDKTSGKLYAWEISRKSVSEHSAGVWFGHNLMVVHGYLALNDAAASEKLFQSAINTIRDKFRAAEPATPAAWQYRNGDNPNASPIQVPLIDTRMFGNVLCHHAEIHISVTERTL